MIYIICTVLICATYLIAVNMRNNALRAEQEAYRQHEVRLYRSENGNDLPSPYILKRELGQTTQNWGYSIFDTRIGKFVSSSGYYEVFNDINEAIDVMNTLETVEGFKITVLVL